MKLVREAEKKSAYIGVVCQKVAETEMPMLEDLHTIGTIGKIIAFLACFRTSLIDLQLDFTNVTKVTTSRINAFSCLLPLGSTKSVSYTHLDVYKRQNYAWFPNRKYATGIFIHTKIWYHDRGHALF